MIGYLIAVMAWAIPVWVMWDTLPDWAFVSSIILLWIGMIYDGIERPRIK